jgi:hypothetical protein
MGQNAEADKLLPFHGTAFLFLLKDGRIAMRRSVGCKRISTNFVLESLDMQSELKEKLPGEIVI